MMATATISKPAAKGGSFLLDTSLPQDVFTPADLTDDQKLIGQTAEEFVVKEVLPLVKDLENKKPGLMPELVKKAGELGLLGGGSAAARAWTRSRRLCSPQNFPSLAVSRSLTARTQASERSPSSISETKSKRK